MCWVPAAQSKTALNGSSLIRQIRAPDPEETFVVTADLRQVSESSSQISSASRAPPFGIDVNADISLSDPLTAVASKCYALVMVDSFDTISTNSTEKD